MGVDDPGIREYIRRAPVTAALALANILFFLWVELHGHSEDPGLLLHYGAAWTPMILGNGEYWRLLTAAFLHFGIRHIASNMLILLVLGEKLEQALGSVAFLVLYLLSAVGGNMVSMLLERGHGYAVRAGASGAVFGVIGGLMAAVIRNGGRLMQLSTRQMFLFAALSVCYGFTAADVDNSAHIAGFCIGFLLSLILFRPGGRRS